MRKESLRLRSLISQLKGANPTRQVRLIRIIFPRWLREHPQRVTRASRYAPRTTHPFDIDLGHRLDKPWMAIERLRAQAAAIPVEILKEIEGAGMTRVGMLLDRLEQELRAGAEYTISRTARLARLTTARQIVKDHAAPPSLAPPRRVVIGKAFAFISHDLRGRLDRMVQNGAMFDAIITNPPYRVTFNGRDVTASADDGSKHALWEADILARLLKPNQALCLFCKKDSLAGWTIALLEAGLTITTILRCPEGFAPQMRAGAEARGDMLVLICGRGVPENFGDAVEGRASAANTTPAEVIGRLIESFTLPGDHILDPFAGSGEVGMAAIARRRDYLGAEADPVEAPKTIGRLQRAYDALQAEEWTEPDQSEVA